MATAVKKEQPFVAPTVVTIVERHATQIQKHVFVRAPVVVIHVAQKMRGVHPVLALDIVKKIVRILKRAELGQCVLQEGSAASALALVKMGNVRVVHIMNVDQGRRGLVVLTRIYVMIAIQTKLNVCRIVIPIRTVMAVAGDALKVDHAAGSLTNAMERSVKNVLARYALLGPNLSAVRQISSVLTRDHAMLNVKPALWIRGVAKFVVRKINNVMGEFVRSAQKVLNVTANVVRMTKLASITRVQNALHRENVVIFAALQENLV